MPPFTVGVVYLSHLVGLSFFCQISLSLGWGPGRPEPFFYGLE